MKIGFLHIKICSMLFLSMYIMSQSTYAQEEITVTGNVKDNKGLAIPGVNVVIKGTSDGTITDLDGNYEIEVKNKETILNFSFVGFRSKEIKVGEQTVINLSLELEDVSIDDIVVVGYGSQKKSDLTGSISSLTSDEMTEVPVTRIDQALEARVPGVQVSSTSGVPGSGARIRIRGHGSLSTNNEPLWIIDGIIGAQISSIAPEDIERIEILKDASSTAIYGARGGNGVIIVSTKRGKKNKTNVSFSAYHKISTIAKKIDVLNKKEYTSLRNEALTNVGFEPMYTEGQINGAEPISGYIADTDWQDQIYKTSHTDNLNLSINGGGDKTRYALSVSHQKAEGIIVDSDYERNGIRLNLDHEINKKISVGLNTNLYRTEQNSFDVVEGWSMGAAGGALMSFPYYPLLDSLGEYFNLTQWDNPVLQATDREYNTKKTGLLGNFFLAYKPIKGLTLKADFSGDYQVFQRNEFVPHYLYGATETRGLTKALIRDVFSNKWIGSLTATYEKTIADIHQIKLLGGIEQTVFDEDYNQMIGEEVDRETYMWYNMGAYSKDYYNIKSGYKGNVAQSQFGRINYSLMNKYLFEATVRRDGSSKFGPQEKWGVFPSASAAWKAHEEDFLKSLDIFDQLKIRASWGISGNDRIATYLWLPTVNTGTSYVFGGVNSAGGDVNVNGATINKIPNESVHWEESRISNIGIDIGVFNNRLRLNLDLYSRQTTELLWNYRLPTYTGYGHGFTLAQAPTVISNIAKMSNKGMEMLLSADIVDKGDFSWSADVNFSKNMNKVISLADDSEFYAGRTKIEPGEPIGNIQGYISDGIFQQGDDIENTPRFTGDESVGDERFLDANGNGKLTSEDQGTIGNALPDYIFGISSRFAYKSFEISAVISGVMGVDMYNETRERLSKSDLGEFNGGVWLLDRWTPENTNTEIPRMSDNYTARASDRFIEDASYIRISNIQLSYSLPHNILDKIKVNSLNIYMSLQNYFTLTKYTGYDPAMSSGYSSSNSAQDNNLRLGNDSQNYPSAKSITMGVKIGI